MEFIQIEVSPREALGTSNSNRLRRAGNIPAVLYGMNRRNLALTISTSEVNRFLKTGSHLVELRLGDETRPAILREMQMDVVSESILHIDFVRVDADVEVDTEVPVTFKGRAKGESEGGVFQVVKPSIHVRATPKNLPASYVIDINEMSLGDHITVGDIVAGEGVTLTEEPLTLIAICAVPQGGDISEADEADAEASAEASAEAEDATADGDADADADGDA